jgi:hypothetical protein
MTSKYDRDSDPHAFIRIGLAAWILIYIDIKSWIRIRIETNADPQHWIEEAYNAYKALVIHIYDRLIYSYTTCVCSTANNNSLLND